MKDDKWVKRWMAPSSSRDGYYTVGQDAEGNYGCSCPGWTRQVRKLCPDCRVLLVKSPKERMTPYLVCPSCNNTVAAPIIERRDCRHITMVKLGDKAAMPLEDAVIARMQGKL